MNYVDFSTWRWNKKKKNRHDYLIKLFNPVDLFIARLYVKHTIYLHKTILIKKKKKSTQCGSAILAFGCTVLMGLFLNAGCESGSQLIETLINFFFLIQVFIWFGLLNIRIIWFGSLIYWFEFFLRRHFFLKKKHLWKSKLL